MVEHLLDVAARAPSGTNMQPWNVIALSGDALETFRQGMVDTFLTDVEPDGIELPYYPSPVFEPYLSRRRKIGWDLYGLLGIARGETDKMRAHMVRNLRFFDAPVGLIVTLDARLELGSWVDWGPTGCRPPRSASFVAGDPAGTPAAPYACRKFPADKTTVPVSTSFMSAAASASAEALALT